MSSWNHRVLAHKEPDGSIYLQIHEVYYDENDEPNGYTENAISVGSENLRGIRWVLSHMKKAIKKPVLWAEDKFPEVYEKVQL